ncbi:MAG: pilus assembly protein PilM [Candidatus Omnitrophota bacterium]
MSLLGIYFGSKTISIVETRAKKIVHNIAILQSTISSGEMEEKVPSDVKLIEIIALLKDELRKNKIESREAVLCLSGKDLIIRTFEIPYLPHEELQSAINFEAKKYIPFKVEELITDFQVKLDKSGHTSLVLFMGIKKETLDRYISILNQLDIKMVSMEYSAFSILRPMKLARLSYRGVIATLSIDIAGGDEINFAVLEDGFPLFSRDIALVVGPQQIDAPGEEIEGSSEILEKLKREIRISLDYYHRKFSTKNIKKLYLLCDSEYRTDLETFMTEIGLSVSFADITKYIDKSLSYSLSFIKGYSASLFRSTKTDIRINILSAREKAVLLKEKEIPLGVASLFKGLHLDYKIVSLSALICVATFIYGIYRVVPLRKALNDVVTARLQVATVKSEASYTELTDIDSRYKRKLISLDGLIKKQLYLTVPLDIMPRALPSGVWLTSFSFNKREEGMSDIALEGMVYLGAGTQEFEAVNKLLSNLKENSDFNKYFTDITIVSVSRGQFGTLTGTNFTINCKN